MALGGGTFLSENKILPGSYINFTSAARADASLSERGTAAIGIEMDWGVDGEIFCVESDEFLTDSIEIFGHQYTDEKLKGIRDLFKNASRCYFYKLTTGEKATCTLGEARYSGEAGNNIKIVVSQKEDDFTVDTYFGSENIDSQVVKTIDELEDNAFVIFNKEATLEASAGINMTGGTNGEADSAAHQKFLEKAENFSFNTLGCLSTEEEIKELYGEFTKQMRDTYGIKFQCVLYKYDGGNEGIISVENDVTDDGENEASLVYWVTGASAGCEINESLTNKTYDGSFTVNTNYKQSALEEGIENGKFMFHKVGDNVKVLEDINTFTEFTTDKNEDFSYNQVVRLIDQIGNDIADLFNTKYLGKVQNNNAGRMAFWNDIVTYNRELERLGVIENFNADDIVVEMGSDKKTVRVTNPVQAVCAMSKLYMTVIVS
jgi:hypothetical protein